MDLKVSGYDFQGPFNKTQFIQEKPGLFLIVDWGLQRYNIIDADEAEKLRSRINKHERQPTWPQHSKGFLTVWVHYTPNLRQDQRAEMVQKIRKENRVPCG